VEVPGEAQHPLARSLDRIRKSNRENGILSLTNGNTSPKSGGWRWKPDTCRHITLLLRPIEETKSLAVSKSLVDNSLQLWSDAVDVERR
jgi:hypothetical protein